MFTGIVQTTAEVAWLEHSPHLLRYALAFPPSLLIDLKIGASVSIHGICQTVVSIKENLVFFDAIAETLQRTTLKTLVLKQKLNIERSAKIGDEIGGHLLSGHIIGTATISHITAPSPEQRIFTFQCEPHWMKYIFPKGYIALNGASLTVVETQPKGQFTVHLIPETLRITTFGGSQVGDLVNLEIDSFTQTIVATVENVLNQQGMLNVHT